MAWEGLGGHFPHKHTSFTPLSFLQDKLLLEPYAMRKSIAYLVIIPSSISNGPSLTPPLKKYFRDLSLVYKVCQCQTLSLMD